MLDSQDKCMQRLAGEFGDRCKRGFLARVFGTRRGPGAAILGVANQGMADMRKMHADLVGAPGFQAAFD